MSEEEKKISAEDPRYQVEYYKSNRKTIAEKKRERYKTDPEYREAILRRTKERRLKLRKKKMKERKRNPPPTKDPMAPTEFKISLGTREVMVNMFTSGQLGSALDRKPQTIRVWERKGILPEALYRSTSGDRLYTEFQLDSLIKIFSEIVAEHGRKAFTRIASTGFPEKALELWKKYPLGIEE